MEYPDGLNEGMKLFWTSTFNNWIYYLHWLHIPSPYGGRNLSILCRTLCICRPSFHHPGATPTNHCKLSSKFMISPFSFSHEWQNFCTPFVAAVVVVATSHQRNYVGPDLTIAGDVWEMRVDLQWNLNNYFDASSGLFSIHPCVRPSVRPRRFREHTVFSTTPDFIRMLSRIVRFNDFTLTNETE